MQYVILLPGLALGHRGELFIQFHMYIPYKDRVRTEPYAKRYPNDTIFFQKRPGDRLVTQKAEQVGDIGGNMS